ncbi:TPA: hypothetical protein N0F65_005088 [Lagenidium giganteum]|uniref:Polyprotein n=1 Tax=Lagenidium giganteum TaxID=4803 RepID=A0AAV2Z796_9STRA|nr:TPA: hypothetical protein N0F65_005088 [Lagenidium giganteum]
MMRPEDLHGSDNYFHWEFNMRMTLARKGLPDHIRVVKQERQVTDEWIVRDAKAFAIIAQGVEGEQSRRSVMSRPRSKPGTYYVAAWPATSTVSAS